MKSLNVKCKRQFLYNFKDVLCVDDLVLNKGQSKEDN